jgi:hypothetical protein
MKDMRFGIVFVVCMLFVAYMIDFNALSATVMSMAAIAIAVALGGR